MSIEQGRRLLYALAAATLMMVSITAGVLITKSLERDDPSPSTVAPAAASTPGEATPSASTASAATATEAPLTDAGLLAAVTKAGDVVLVDPDTAAVVQTVSSASGGTPAERVAWHAATGVAYFSRPDGDCYSIWQSRPESRAKARHLGSGQLLAVSPDGTRLAISTCRDATAGNVDVIDAKSGKTTVSLPLSTLPYDQGGGMWLISDIDWRPDSAAIVVTAGWEEEFGQFLIDLRKLPQSVTTAPLVPVKTTFEESYHTVEYVGTRLVMSGSCCYPENKSNRVVVRDGKSGELSSLMTESVFDLAADSKGRLRYLTSRGSEGAAELWALDRLDGVPRKIGGEFIAIDW